MTVGKYVEYDDLCRFLFNFYRKRNASFLNQNLNKDMYVFLKKENSSRLDIYIYILIMI